MLRAALPALAALTPAASSEAFPSGYTAAVDRYFSDVAAASQAGATDNVYSVTAQYTDSMGNPVCNSTSGVGCDSPTDTAMVPDTFGGEIDDSDPFPSDVDSGNTTSGCQELSTTRAGDPLYTYCLTDTQIQTELSSVIAARGLPSDLTAIYFVLLGPGVDECFEPGPESNPGNPCADTDFCAYHSSFSMPNPNGNGSDNVPPVYAVIPWPDVSGCQSDEAPNGSGGGSDDDPGDDAASVMSHENNESVTNPLDSAWYDDNSGDEVADLCAPNHGGQTTIYGPPLTGSPSAASGMAYNQTINGDHYYLQEEYSLQDEYDTAADGTCEQRPATAGENGSEPTNPTCPPTAATCPPPDVTYHGGPVIGTHATYAIYWDPAQVGQNPSAAFSASATTAHIGQPVSFTAADTSDPQGLSLTYAWNFGDGTSTSTAQPTVNHAFALSGNHVVQLTVSDPDGYSSSSSQTVTVYQPPTAAFTASPGALTAGQPASFDAQASGDSDGTIEAWSWSFGDGQNGSGELVKHTFARAGSYTVTLTLGDSNDSTGTDSQTVRVLAPPVATIARTGSIRISLSHGHVLVTSGRSVSCPAAASGCTASVTLTTRVTAKRGARAHVVKIATGSLKIASGHRSAITLTLNSTGVDLLRRLRKLGTTIVVAAQAKGGISGSATGTLKLSAPRSLARKA